MIGYMLSHQRITSMVLEENVEGKLCRREQRVEYIQHITKDFVGEEFVGSSVKPVTRLIRRIKKNTFCIYILQNSIRCTPPAE